MKPVPVHRSFWTQPFTILLGTFVLFFGSQLVSGSLLAQVKHLLPSNNQQLAVFVAINVVMLVGMLSIAFRISGYSWRSIGFVKPSAKALLSVMPAFVVYMAISTCLTLLAVKFVPGFKADQVQDIGFDKLHSKVDLITGFISLIILTPIFEETVFRGVLFKGLRKRLPFIACAIITSSLFALAHGQLNVALDTFALSIIMCLLVERSGSIIPSMVLHAAKNSLAFVFLFLLPR